MHARPSGEEATICSQRCQLHLESRKPSNEIGQGHCKDGCQRRRKEGRRPLASDVILGDLRRACSGRGWGEPLAMGRNGNGNDQTGEVSWPASFFSCRPRRFARSWPGRKRCGASAVPPSAFALPLPVHTSLPVRASPSGSRTSAFGSCSFHPRWRSSFPIKLCPH